MIAHTMIVAISVIFFTSLAKSTDHMNGVVHTVVSFLDAGTASHGGFPTPVGILPALLSSLNARHAPDRILPAPLPKIFLVFLCKHKDTRTILALKVFFHSKQLLLLFIRKGVTPF